MPYSRSIKFDDSNMTRRLEEFDQRARDFIKRDVEVHTTQGELTMKTKAPWRDRTTDARRGLWADSQVNDHNINIEMGHAVEYGIYLEESNNGKFQIVMPTLIATARSFMQSLEHMFAQLETRTPVSPIITPGVGTRPGTSQNAKTHTVGAQTRPNLGIRTEKGRFADQGKGFSKAAKAAKAAAKKLAERNARRRELYRAKKNDITPTTKKTKRG